jgi:hypothetical protein
MKKLKYYGGQGYGYSNEIGKFEVNGKPFTKLSEAKEYYESLNEEKSIWEVTTAIPELIEGHTFN